MLESAIECIIYAGNKMQRSSKYERLTLIIVRICIKIDMMIVCNEYIELQLKQMKDVIKSDIQIYEYYSQCLKNFRQRMLLLCRIQTSQSQQLKDELQQNLTKIINQGQLLFNKFQQFSSSSTNINLQSLSLSSIFSRFLFRVKQSLYTIITRTSTSQIIHFLKFLQNVIKEFNYTTNMTFIMKIILIKIPKPKIFTSIPPLQTGFSLKTQIITNKKQIFIQNKISEIKSQKYFDSYDKYLEGLQRQYRLFDCMNIQKPDYRRVFFLALEDQQQQMMNRNRFVKESLINYERNYEKLKKKQADRKHRLIKQVQQRHLTIFKQKQPQQQAQYTSRQDPTKSSSSPKRVRSQYQNKSDKKQANISLISETYRSYTNRKLINMKQRLKTLNQSPLQLQVLPQQGIIKNKLQQYEKKKIIKNIHVIPLKKVQFGGNRIQLLPQQLQKKNMYLQQNQKKINYYKKTQQNFRKKVSIFTQNKFHKGISDKNHQNKFNSIKIQFIPIILD